VTTICYTLKLVIKDKSYTIGILKKIRDFGKNELLQKSYPKLTKTIAQLKVEKYKNQKYSSQLYSSNTIHSFILLAHIDHHCNLLYFNTLPLRIGRRCSCPPLLLSLVLFFSKKNSKSKKIVFFDFIYFFACSFALMFYRSGTVLT
jgi:hypothetical protein